MQTLGARGTCLELFNGLTGTVPFNNAQIIISLLFMMHEQLFRRCPAAIPLSVQSKAII